jgi:hypothetical protein
LDNPESKIKCGGAAFIPIYFCKRRRRRRRRIAVSAKEREREEKETQRNTKNASSLPNELALSTTTTVSRFTLGRF